jgi:hypothetical protein
MQRRALRRARQRLLLQPRSAAGPQASRSHGRSASTSNVRRDRAGAPRRSRCVPHAGGAKRSCGGVVRARMCQAGGPCRPIERSPAPRLISSLRPGLSFLAGEHQFGIRGPAGGHPPGPQIGRQRRQYAGTSAAPCSMAAMATAGARIVSPDRPRRADRAFTWH